jgi:hypothetical protein
MMLFLFVLLALSRLYVSRLLVRNLIAAALCSGGWHESFGIILSVVGGFLWMLKDKRLSILVMEMSRKLILLSVSFSIVNFKVGVSLLKQARTSCMLVRFCL